MRRNLLFKPIRDFGFGSCRRSFLRGAVISCAIGIPSAAKCEMLFSSNSPWNCAIPYTAVVGSVNIAARLPVGLDTWDPNNYWVIPYYEAKASDPQVEVLYNPLAWAAVSAGAWRRSGNKPAVEAAIRASSSGSFPYPGNVFSSTSTSSWSMPDSYNRLKIGVSGAARFSVPSSNLLPAAAADGHMAVRQPSGGVLETYGTIVLSDQTIVALSYAVTDPSGLGDGWQRGQTASMLPSYAGAILDGEIISGIEHAMSITVPPKLLLPKIAYPAYAFDRDALTNATPYSGSLPMGSRLALPFDLKISDLHLTTMAGRAIAAAALKYGFFIVDRGGEGITIRVRPSVSPSQPELHSYDARLNGDLTQIFAHLRAVTF
jgi:hypothetical protein